MHGTIRQWICYITSALYSQLYAKSLTTFFRIHVDKFTRKLQLSALLFLKQISKRVFVLSSCPGSAASALYPASAEKGVGYYGGNRRFKGWRTRVVGIFPTQLWVGNYPLCGRFPPTCGIIVVVPLRAVSVALDLLT